jgi:hypothetical protein
MGESEGRPVMSRKGVTAGKFMGLPQCHAYLCLGADGAVLPRFFLALGALIAAFAPANSRWNFVVAVTARPNARDRDATAHLRHRVCDRRFRRRVLVLRAVARAAIRRAQAQPEVRQGQRDRPEERRHLPDDHRPGSQFRRGRRRPGRRRRLAGGASYGLRYRTGYLLARPTPKASFLTLLRQRTLEKAC